ncbi:MAG: ceramidase [Paracoccaceae bacterium]|nr:ceramidase [Paracoccaceae bacterium]
MGQIDLYCERVGGAFWAEPLNALTNFSFLIAAWALWRIRPNASAPPAESVLLIGTIAAIGIGSFLFHTFATRWAATMDVLPILVFQLLFLWFYARRRMGAGWVVAAGLLIAYLALGFAVGQSGSHLNGSIGYLPALMVLIALALHHARTASTLRYNLLAASGMFALSLTLRTIDRTVCDSLPIGTHFLWHILNAAVLFLAARALIGQPAYRPSR